MRLKELSNNKLFKVGAFYSVTSTLSAVASMIVGLLNMRWLGPELLGIWQSITIINSYLPFLQLGIQSGLNVDLPILLGSGKQDEANCYVGTAKTFAIFLSIFIAIVGSGVATYMILSHKDLKITVGVIAIVYLAFLSCFHLHLIATYRSASAFDKLSKIYLVDTAVTFLLIFFIWKYLYYGLVFFNVAKETIKVLLMYHYAPYRKLKRSYNGGIFKNLLKRGVLMTLLAQMNGVIQSFPRIILLSLGGVVKVGLFSPALAVEGLMNLIPNQLVQFLQPQMGFKYGQTNQASSMLNYINKLTLYLPLFTLPFSIIGFLLIGPVLEFFFPKYLESLWAVRIMLIGFLFSTSSMSRNFLITIKAYKEVFILYGIDMILFLSIPYVMIKLELFTMLTSLALGLSVSFLISYILNYIVVSHTILQPRYNKSE